MTLPALDELLNDEAMLPTLPRIVIELIGLLDRPDADLEEISQLIGNDAVLSARVLRVINSAYYALPFKVDSISQAVGLVGFKALRELALATRVADTFKGIASNLLDVRSFWENSFISASLARELAQPLELDENKLFVAGLLHHLGIMVMLEKMPDVMVGIIQQARANEQELHAEELATLGYSHADVGARLLEQWQLPPFFVELSAYHHDFYRAPHYAAEAAVIHLADTFAQIISPMASMQGMEERPDLAVYDYITLSGSRLDALAQTVLAERGKAGMLLQ